MVVRYYDFCPIQIIAHVGRHEFAAGIVGVRIVRLENPQAVLDGQAGCNDQEPARESRAGRSSDSVDCLPGYKHGHDGCLTGTGRQL